MIKLTKIMTLLALNLAIILVNNSRILSQSFSEEMNVEFTTDLVIKENNIDTDPFALMKEESLGDLKIDLSAQQVIKLIGNPQRKGKSEYWAGDGFYHQYWYYPSQGITLSMASETRYNQQKVAFIKLVSPSILQTKRGIKIGSSLEKVILAYAQEQDQEMSIPCQSFVAGSIYGGLIFTFENGYVSQIFLGAAAE